ncbi:MAG: DUF3530 family protein [Pseudomonadota bacterium]|nr:MAG: DUF3530 family protein [Pseudomonadota bacterium]
MRIRAILLILLLTFPDAVLLASDRAKEQRWAEQIVDALLVGEAEWLSADGAKFLAIYAEPDAPQARGAAILLHGIGVHPDWPEVVSPLRTGLPEHGWATLSLQMPVLPNEATLRDYVPLFAEVPARIQAGIAFLRKRKFDNIVIIAHSLGAAMGATFLAAHPDSGTRAFVAIGMSALNEDPRMSTLRALSKIHLPVLDLYGSRDLEQVLNSAGARADAARTAANKTYLQERVEGADHFFRGMDDTLVTRVNGWIGDIKKTK